MIPFCTRGVPLELQLSDEALQAEQTKAEKYASEPEQITLFSTELEMKSVHGNCLILYDEGDWSCSCDFFQTYATCSHVMAVGRILKPIPIIQPRGNVED